MSFLHSDGVVAMLNGVILTSGLPVSLAGVKFFPEPFSCFLHYTIIRTFKIHPTELRWTNHVHM